MILILSLQNKCKVSTDEGDITLNCGSALCKKEMCYTSPSRTYCNRNCALPCLFSKNLTITTYDGISTNRFTQLSTYYCSEGVQTMWSLLVLFAIMSVVCGAAVLVFALVYLRKKVAHREQEIIRKVGKSYTS